MNGNLIDGQPHNGNTGSQRQCIFSVLGERNCHPTKLCLKRTSLENETMTFAGREKKRSTHHLHTLPRGTHEEGVLRNGYEMWNGKVSRNIGDYGNTFEQIRLFKTIITLNSWVKTESKLSPGAHTVGWGKGNRPKCPRPWCCSSGGQTSGDSCRVCLLHRKMSKAEEGRGCCKALVDPWVQVQGCDYGDYVGNKPVILLFVVRFLMCRWYILNIILVFVYLYILNIILAFCPNYAL